MPRLVRFPCLVLAGAFVAAVPVVSGAAEVDFTEPVLRLPPARTAPVIDGEIGEVEWANAWMMEGSVGSGDQALEERRAWAYITYDKQHLYLAIRSATRPGGKLYMWDHDPDEAVMRQDGVELWVAPLEDPKEAPIDKFQIWYDPSGTQWALVHRYGAGFKVKQELERASRIIGDEWHIEVAFPWAAAGLKPEDIVDGKHILVRPCRNWRANGIYASWGGKGAFYLPTNMIRLLLDSKAPVVRIPDLGKPFDGKLAIKVEARGRQAATLTAKAELTPLSRKPGEAAKPATVITKPVRVGGAAATLSAQYEAPPLLPDREQTSQRRSLHYSLELHVADATGKVLFKRFMYIPGRREKLWAKLPERETKLAGGYYPYYGKIRATLDLGEHPQADEITSAKIVLRPDGGGKVLAEGTVPEFRYNVGTSIFGVGDLKDGTYTMTATLFAGKEEVKTPEPVTRSFTREKQPWEHNDIGKSAKVYPPFAPIEVKGSTVSCVLRDHEMNGFGLCDQVVAKGQPILAGPMRLECRAGGEQLEWKTKRGPDFGKKADHEVRLQGKGSCEALEVRTDGLWEYDGMLKVVMDVEPKGDAQVDELELVIPVKQDIARLLHSTTATRSNPSMEIPAGQGVVWDSNAMVQTVGKGSFTPYVWIGGIERGICWFADNDRGWVTDDKEPAIEVERDGTAVNLRIRFINRPTTLKAVRRIVFGLMATPVKPIPAESRAWGPFKGAARSYSTSFSSWRFVGFAQHESLTPMGNDFSIFEYFAKHQGTGNTPKDARDHIYNWMKQYRDDPDKGGVFAQLWKTFSNTVRTDEAVYYTNPGLESGGTPQGKQFKNEWRSGVSSLGCNFTDSYNDYAAWAYDSMLKSGLKCHVYQDNTFPVASTDLIAGTAYVREDGRVQAGWNIFGHREFYKRLFVTGWKRMGRMPLTYPHTTNGMTIPQFSFATIHLALEWEQYGTRTFQEKFQFPLLQTEVMGKQAGLIPRVLCSMGPRSRDAMSPEERARLTAELYRTREGVLLLHDSFGRSHGKYIGDVVRLLMPYGFHKESCAFIGYWDDPKGVEATPGTAVSLFRMDQGVLAVVVDTSGKEGARRISIDPKALGRPVKKIIDFEQHCYAKYADRNDALYQRIYEPTYTAYGAARPYYHLDNGFKQIDATAATVNLRKHDYCLLLIE
jgi:hypothetical protein